ncbi:hypothetical protein CDAR_166601 [Caerostris darwini]|uniref:Uncharacterized protein n=1 Tax=Caerostris darwini TaxID=1538125 RepID=A0AAV4NE54_9ARAC|nr:hypothetical protein CDAR_166601 [Caerostris darwini]
MQKHILGRSIPLQKINRKLSLRSPRTLSWLSLECKFSRYSSMKIVRLHSVFPIPLSGTTINVVVVGVKDDGWWVSKAARIMNIMRAAIVNECQPYSHSGMSRHSERTDCTT